MEWLILLLLVPAILVPVVLLWGFAGCDLVFKLERPAPPKPEGLEATPISVSAISLTWSSTGTDLKFDIRRAPDGGSFESLGSVVSGPPFVDPPSFATLPPLEPGVTYNYQVFAIQGDDETGSDVARARPLAFDFDLSTPNGTNQTGFGGDCIVQKITAPVLKNWGTVVRIHVRGSTAADLTINSIYISRVARSGGPANPNPDAYDSDADLTLVALGLFVPANSSVSVDLPSVYTIPETLEDLLIAFDISSSPGQGNVRRAPLNGVVAFTRNATQQAAVADRFPNPDNPNPMYVTVPDQLYLVEKIEVL